MTGFITVHEDGQNTPMVIALNEIAQVREQYITGKAFICTTRMGGITPLLCESVDEIAKLIAEAQS